MQKNGSRQKHYKYMYCIIIGKHVTQTKITSEHWIIPCSWIFIPKTGLTSISLTWMKKNSKKEINTKLINNSLYYEDQN